MFLTDGCNLTLTDIFFVRAAKDDAKKREQQQAMIANRGIYPGTAAANGTAEGVGHAQPLGYGTYGGQTEYPYPRIFCRRCTGEGEHGVNPNAG